MAGKDLKKSLKVGALVFLFIAAGLLSTIISSAAHHTGTEAAEPAVVETTAGTGENSHS